MELLSITGYLICLISALAIGMLSLKERNDCTTFWSMND